MKGCYDCDYAERGYCVLADKKFDEVIECPVQKMGWRRREHGDYLCD